MRSFLKGTAIALALAGTVLVTGAASADNYSHNDRNRGASVLAIAFSDIAFGFRDGYWDMAIVGISGAIAATTAAIKAKAAAITTTGITIATLTMAGSAVKSTKRA